MVCVFHRSKDQPSAASASPRVHPLASAQLIVAAAYTMDACSACILLSLIHLLSSVSARDFLLAGSSLSVEHSSDVLHSADGTFACGFYSISLNASTFAIWFSRSSERTIVWSANPLHPVYTWGSKVELDVDGSMVLKDYNGHIVWSNNVSTSDAVPCSSPTLGQWEPHCEGQRWCRPVAKL